MSQQRTERRLPLLIFLALLTLLALRAATAWAAQPRPSRRPARIAAPTWEQRRQLVHLGVAMEGVDLESGLAWALLDEGQVSRLRQEGFVVEWEVQPQDFPPADSDYHDYAETVAALEAIAASYPDIARLTTMGWSWEGRAIQG
ncbi:MAG: zinc carboxypeptidase, partial [Chloroflexi bacterium]|nr:zinc carboxypeptidase [Chloroflexota bacterium]